MRHILLSSIVLATLTACGGGGGSSDSTGAAPVPSSPTPTRVAKTVKMTGLSVKASDILVQTGSLTKTAGLSDVIMKLIPSAMADVIDKINPGANFGFTNKVKNGLLVSLDVKLAPTDGSTLTCDTSTAEVKINKAWRVHSAYDHVLIDADVPSTVNADCSVLYKNGLFTVSDAGVVSEITFPGESVKKVIEAGNPSSNSSNQTVIVFDSGIVRTVSITNDVTSTRDLNDKNIPLKLSIDNTVAFDGNVLVGLPSDRNDAVLAFDANSKAFKIISTAMGSPTVPVSGYTSQVFLTDDGKFVWYEWGSYARELNVQSGSYKPWAPAQRTMVTDPSSPSYGTGGLPNGLYGFNGRWNQWIQSDRCMLWNYSTNETLNLSAPATPSAPASDSAMVTFSKLDGGYGFCISGNGTTFSRVNMADKSIASFNTDQLGYYMSANRKTELYADRAVLWDTVSTTNSDVHVIELNFDTGLTVDRGVISVGDRKVVQFVPVK